MSLSCLTSTTPSGEQKQSESDNHVCGVLLSYPWKKLTSPEEPAASSLPAERSFSLWNQPVFKSGKEWASEGDENIEKDGWSSPLGSDCSEPSEVPSEVDGKDGWNGSYDNYSSDLSDDADEKYSWGPFGSYLSVAYHAAYVIARRATVAEDGYGMSDEAYRLSEDAYGMVGWSSTSSDHSDQSGEPKRQRGRRGGRQRSARRRKQQESKVFRSLPEDDQRRLSFNPCPHGV